MPEVIVNAQGLVTNPKKCEMSRTEAIEYAKKRMGEVMSVLDLEPTHANITMWTEGEDRDPTQKVTMRISYRTLDKPIIQEAHSRNIQRAIDRCIDPMTRQVRRAKTKLIDKRRQDTRQTKMGIERTQASDMSDELTA
jgi:ribosome-associated translation inhibitor RaiA